GETSACPGLAAAAAGGGQGVRRQWSEAGSCSAGHPPVHSPADAKAKVAQARVHIRPTPPAMDLSRGPPLHRPEPAPARGVAGVLFRASLPRLPAGGELSEPEPNAEGAVLASGHGSEPAAGAKTGLARAEGHQAHLWRGQAVARTGAEPLPRAGTDGDSGAADLPGAQRQEDGLSIQRCAWTSKRASAPGTGGCVSRSAPVGSRTKWKSRSPVVPHVPSSRWQPLRPHALSFPPVLQSSRYKEGGNMPAGDASELELVLKVLSRTRRMERSDKKLTSFA